jgi:hypothetical protein
VLPVREAILWRRAVKQQQQLHADAAAQEASCHRFVAVLLCATFDHIVVNCSVLVVVPFSCIVFPCRDCGAADPNAAQFDPTELVCAVRDTMLRHSTVLRCYSVCRDTALLELNCCVGSCVANVSSPPCSLCPSINTFLCTSHQCSIQGCSAGGAAEVCPKHGTDYLEHKCRYCCSVAVWFCFGTVRVTTHTATATAANTATAVQP